MFDFIKNIESKRGTLVHGSYNLKDIQEDRFISNADMGKLASIIRRSLLGFVVLYLRGETDRGNIHKKLNSGIFVKEDLESLHSQSDPKIYIDEILTALG
jgi:uncharacterized protein with PIN domain